MIEKDFINQFSGYRRRESSDKFQNLADQVIRDCECYELRPSLAVQAWEIALDMLLKEKGMRRK